ncbi:MAG: hypothetical protein H8E83_06075 [Planctomycetes bacterium]|nr:hypothetical protein [Planctomycetota bacterium]
MLVQFAIGFLIAALTSCFTSSGLTVEEILDNVETANVASVTANVAYTRTDPMLNRKEIRTGKILFRTLDGNKREAAIMFDTLIIGRRKETKQKHYIFSGRWMVEIDREKKQFIKRELIAPDKKNIDPFELGSGPIPLPIGQKKEEVLLKFKVERVSKPNTGPLAKLDDTVVGLHLTPKTKDEWEYIDLFYDPSTWLPVGVCTVELDGTKRESRLTNIKVNALSKEEASLLSVLPPDPKEWSIDIRPWVD